MDSSWVPGLSHHLAGSAREDSTWHEKLLSSHVLESGVSDREGETGEISHRFAALLSGEEDNHRSL